MKPGREAQRLAQRILNRETQAGLVEDGSFGPVSVAAARRWFPVWPFRGEPTPERYVAAIIQRAAGAEGIQAGAYDGFWGPQTADAAYRMMGPQHVGWRPDEAGALLSSGPVRCWTPTDQQMQRAYGAVGTGQTRVTLPYEMRLDWDLESVVTTTMVHRAAAASLVGALETVRDAYGVAGLRALGLDRFGGVLNVRRKRGGSSWSAHAWGVAIDLYPSGNELAWKRDRAVFARREYEPLRQAFEAAGWMSLGQCYDFDWMHWQRNPQAAG